MKIELRNIKHSKFASRETDCFQATVYVDGVKKGTVENDGWGGPNSYHPNTLWQELDAYAKSLPKYEWKGSMLSHSADGLIYDAFNEAALVKDFKKTMASRVAFYDPAKNEVRQTVALKPAQIQDAIANKHKLPEVLRSLVCLNELPVEEAFGLFKKALAQ